MADPHAAGLATGAQVTRPIKVMRVIARMNVGGPAWQVSVLTRGLQPPEFETHLVCGRVADDEADFIALRDPSLPCTYLEGLGRSVKPLDDVRALMALVRMMRREKPDIVHTHTAKAGVLGRLAAMVARVPHRVHTFHGHVLHGYFSPRITRLIIFIERFLARHTDVLAAVGAQVRDDLLAAKIGRPKQYRVVPPGVRISAGCTKEEARRRFDLPADVPVVLFVGRLTRIKRVDRLIEAMTKVHEQLPAAVLAIAGEGDLLSEVEELASPLGRAIRFLGWQSDLSVVYPLADVVALTSDNEGMPVTLIEASMLGIPCVTTDVGSAREVVLDHQTGRVITPDATAIADALVELLSDTARLAQFGSNARQHAEASFGSPRLIDDYAKIYREINSQGM
jgi:glycosyltransferase involved in cell wall biosynthesis